MSIFRSILIAFMLLAGVGVGFSAEEGGEQALRLKTTLLWGTNDDPAKHKDCKPADEAIAKKFRKVFKWKHYFEIDTKEVTVQPHKVHSVKMSKKSELKIRNLGKLDNPKAKKDSYRIEVKLFGEGKQVINRKQPIAPGETITLAGNDKNDTAWFIAVTRH